MSEQTDNDAARPPLVELRAIADELGGFGSQHFTVRELQKVWEYQKASELDATRLLPEARRLQAKIANSDNRVRQVLTGIRNFEIKG